MSAIDDLKATMARLRAPDGCPWDQEQTHASLVRCLIDEVSELIDTIDRDDLPHMREELGDVLIQIVFHSQIAAEQGQFTFDDVARDINEKLIRRHPHVFGSGKLETSEQVIVEWEKIKAAEKKNGPAAESGAGVQGVAAAPAGVDVCRGDLEAGREEAAAGAWNCGYGGGGRFEFGPRCRYAGAPTIRTDGGRQAARLGSGGGAAAARHIRDARD